MIVTQQKLNFNVLLLQSVFFFILSGALWKTHNLIAKYCQHEFWSFPGQW